MYDSAYCTSTSSHRWNEFCWTIIVSEGSVLGLDKLLPLSAVRAESVQGFGF